MKKTRKKQIVTIALLVIFLGSTFAMFQPEEKKETWKVKLEIAIFGELHQIPSNVGVNGETKSKLYTFESDNVIYKTGEEDARLKEFFDIWGENFNSTCIFDYCNNENHSMKMYVNGVENTDYELYVMKNNDIITIDYR